MKSGDQAEHHNNSSTCVRSVIKFILVQLSGVYACGYMLYTTDPFYAISSSTLKN
jgi:hypothetical protein